MKTHSSPLSWSRQTTPEPLHSALEALGNFYLITETAHGATLSFSPAEDAALLRCSSDGERFQIEYGSLTLALRGVGYALSRKSTLENAAFEKFGIMLDCSRNAVMTVPTVKRWLSQLSLLGYNRLMLYTEDTYQLPGEPCFGYMRGAYSAEEIREIDSFAASLGIEVIACIQTLGHLNQILKWSAYKNVTDTASVLLVDAEPTYELITKMIRFWQENLRSRRIHIGMDEAHDMGRGRFLDKNGWQPPFDTFTRHLKRVSGICEAHGLKPMIWSDMYFRMGNAKMEYYDPETVIPTEVAQQIPQGVDLVYWDYYSKNVAFYQDWIQRHRALGKEPLMASGIWTWSRFWYDHNITKNTAEPCIQACREEDLKEFMFTMWGDGGSYCDFESAFAGLAWGADLAHGGNGCVETVAPMLRGVTGGDYEWILKGSEIQVSPGNDNPIVPPPAILWDDLLMGISRSLHSSEVWPVVETKLKTLRADLETMPPQHDSISWGYLKALLDFILTKLPILSTLEEAYRNKDRETLERLANVAIPELQNKITVFGEKYREQWLRRNKPFGMEGFQFRIGGMKERCAETSRRINDYLNGVIPCIEEIEARRTDLNSAPMTYYYWIATGSVII